MSKKEVYQAMAIAEGWTFDEATGGNEDIERVKAQKVDELWS